MDRINPLRPMLLLVLIVVTLGACNATTEAATGGPVAAFDVGTNADPPTTPPAHPKPRLSEPLPPEFLPDPVKLDRSCQSDADCTIKNVGNCCGEYPSCVNVDSPTAPERVQAQCARDGVASICGFPVLEGCRCVAGQCEDRPAMVDPVREVFREDP